MQFVNTRLSLACGAAPAFYKALHAISATLIDFDALYCRDAYHVLLSDCKDSLKENTPSFIFQPHLLLLHNMR